MSEKKISGAYLTRPSGLLIEGRSVASVTPTGKGFFAGARLMGNVFLVVVQNLIYWLFAVKNR